ncbi:pyridoxamine 5'-phosphate oxidase family protein [Microbacterium oleivorans]|nr:pyridoxamine 5'-phosphate oxidase family protein [Microbacterium oleivorans]
MAADGRVSSGRDTAEMTTGECWTLLEGAALGRFAVQGETGDVDIFPMNFLVHAGGVFVRSASGSKMRAIAARPRVAFEVDGEDDTVRWSVVVHGKAILLTEEPEIREAGVRHLVSWSPTAKFIFIHIVPEAISGRRFLKSPAPARVHLTEIRFPAERSFAARKPQPIPHFPPARTAD